MLQLEFKLGVVRAKGPGRDWATHNGPVFLKEWVAGVIEGKTLVLKGEWEIVLVGKHLTLKSPDGHTVFVNMQLVHRLESYPSRYRPRKFFDVAFSNRSKRRRKKSKKDKPRRRHLNSVGDWP